MTFSQSKLTYMNAIIQKEHPLPLYVQLSNYLESQIRSGSLKGGEALPTERSLMEDFSLSRATVRGAIQKLKQKQLVQTRHGAGNFVMASEKLERDLLGVHNFDLQIEAKGHKNHVQLLEFSTTYENPTIASYLNLNAKAPLIKVQRLRLADNAPLFIESIYLSAIAFKELTKDDFLSTHIFSKRLKQDYDTHIQEVKIQLEPVLLTAQEGAALEVLLPAAGLLNERISSDDKGQPIVYSKWLFDSHRCKHMLKMTVK